jgi:DNA topoisomerase-2
METETAEEQVGGKGKKGPSKRGGKKASSSLEVIHDEEDDNVDVSMEVPEEVKGPKKGRGRKPAAAPVKPKATATRKRAPTKDKAMMLKPTEDINTIAPSPEKKVRKMRESPFNKKSGSILQRGSAAASSTSSEASPPSGSSAEPGAAPQPRRTARATTKKMPVYNIESEDEDEDEVVEVTDDSDFDVDGDSDE